MAHQSQQAVTKLYSGAVTLGTNNLLTASAGAITFGGTVDSATATAKNLTLTASGLSTFNNTVGATHALNALTITNAAYLNGASVATSGNQLYSGVVTLGTDNVVSASAGTIGFSGTIDSANSTPESLTVTASGLASFNGAIGAGKALNNLTVTNAVKLNGSSVNTSGNQLYSGVVTLGTDNVLTAGGTIVLRIRLIQLPVPLKT